MRKGRLNKRELARMARFYRDIHALLETLPKQGMIKKNNLPTQNYGRRNRLPNSNRQPIARRDTAPVNGTVSNQPGLCMSLPNDKILP
jgi:hypothetical protein